MKSIYLKLILVAVFSLFVAGQLQASDANLSRSVDGIDIYMGITHANNTEAMNVKELGMIQKIKGKKHHITVALFDKASGARITDAKVMAVIGEMGLSSNRKKLKQEKYGDAVSYGRDFYLSKEGPYWIDLNIKRNGATQTLQYNIE